MSDYDKEVDHYNVIVRKRTASGDFHKEKTETFYDIELAVEYAKTYDTEKDYSVTIQEVSNIIEWQ